MKSNSEVGKLNGGVDHPTEPSPPPDMSLEEPAELLFDVEDAVISVSEQKTRPAVVPIEATPALSEPVETDKPTIVDDPPPVQSMPFGSWDGPEEELDKGALKKSKHPSQAPTPSLMPALKAATQSRNRTALAFFFVIILLGGGAYALTLMTPEDQPQTEAGAVATPAGSGQALVDESVAGSGEADEPQEQAQNRGRRAFASAGDDEGREAGEEEGSALGLAGGHGGVQEVGSGAIETDGNRQVRGGDGELRERSSFRGRSRRGGSPLSSEQIRTAVGANARSIRSCHEREMRRSGMPIQGRVVVRIVVGGSGAVRDAQVVSGPSIGGLTSCIEQAVATWRFPEASAQTVVETPFVLASRQ